MSSRPVMLVTGGSRGIGAATVLLAAARGYDICFSYVTNSDVAEQTCVSAETFGARCFAHRADAADNVAMKGLFEFCDTKLGAPDVVVNNAGIVGTIGKLQDASYSEFEAILRTNVLGSFTGAQEAVRRMSTLRGGRGGSIINLSSRAAQLGGSGEWVHYAASKAAIDILTVGLAREVAAEGLRVNAVRPGVIDTDIHESAGDATRVARIQRSLPMQRAGQASEVAEAIIWLASPAASYVNGAVLDVAGAR